MFETAHCVHTLLYMCAVSERKKTGTKAPGDIGDSERELRTKKESKSEKSAYMRSGYNWTKIIPPCNSFYIYIHV